MEIFTSAILSGYCQTACGGLQMWISFKEIANQCTTGSWAKKTLPGFSMETILVLQNTDDVAHFPLPLDV